MHRPRLRLELVLIPFFAACAPREPARTATPCPAPAATRAALPCPSVAKTSEPAASGVDAMAARVVALVNARDARALFALFDAGMREAVPEDKTRAVIESILGERGKLVSHAPLPGGSARSGSYRLVAERGEWRLGLSLDGEGKIAGLFFKDPPPPAPEVAKSSIPIGLPFEGQWTVFWGGDTRELNHHIDHASQRRAADFVIYDAAGKTHRGDGKDNRDYYAYGQKILAVADGTVVTVVDGVPDNAPGDMNPYLAPGNFVMLRHEGTLHSLYAHLQPKSARVKPGAKVKRGAVLGLAGNSGNSSEAHLHFQLQDGPLFEKSWGVEAVFASVPVERAGKRETLDGYVLRKGDRVGATMKR